MKLCGRYCEKFCALCGFAWQDFLNVTHVKIRSQIVLHLLDARKSLCQYT